MFNVLHWIVRLYYLLLLWLSSSNEGREFMLCQMELSICQGKGDLMYVRMKPDLVFVKANRTLYMSGQKGHSLYI